MSKINVTLIIPNRYPDQWGKWVSRLKDPGMDYALNRIYTGDRPEFSYTVGGLFDDAVRQAETEFIVYSNDDIYPLTDGWLKKLYDMLVRYPFATVSPWQINQNNASPHFSPDMLYLAHLNSEVIKFCSFGFSLFRRDQFLEVGGWDKNYNWWYGDNDISRRMEKFGPHAYTFGVLSHHDVSATADRSPRQDIYEELKEKDRLYYNKKWNDRLPSLKKEKAA